jgi:hypothetical protein
MSGDGAPDGAPILHRPVPAQAWRHRVSRRRLLGIVLPIAAGLVCSNVDLSILLLAWMPFLLGVLSAVVLRSWWSLLIVPLALAIGMFPSLIVGWGGFPT